MTLKLNGIELEFPDDTAVEVSEDGKHVKVSPPEPEVVERIVFTDSGPNVIERIVIQEVEKPCNRRHYDDYRWPQTYPWTTTTGGTIGGSGITWNSNTRNDGHEIR